MHDFLSTGFILLLLALFLLSGVFYLILMKFYNKANLLQNTIIKLEKENALLHAENKFIKEQAVIAEQKVDHKLKIQFEHYTEHLLKNKTDLLQKETSHNINNITSLLAPLKEKLTEFQKQVERTYQEESREMFSLKNEISKLLVNNASIAKETENLTSALKGNVKAQGIWGEIILERVLESSGLRNGVEYITQGQDLNLKDDDNKSVRPDVIINLPDNKHLIIDAKVSLVNYEQYINYSKLGDTVLEQEQLRLFVKSIQAHINNLSGKHYQYNEKLLSPDFVMLFFPIEGAFSIALQAMPDLLLQAWNNKIIIVSPC